MPSDKEIEAAAIAMILDDYVSMADYYNATSKDDIDLYRRCARVALEAAEKVRKQDLSEIMLEKLNKL